MPESVITGLIRKRYEEACEAWARECRYEEQRGWWEPAGNADALYLRAAKWGKTLRERQLRGA